MNKFITTKTGTAIRIDENGIIHFCHIPNYRIMIDLNNVKFITRDVRKYFSEQTLKNFVSAVVIITKSSMSKVMANFLLGINKPLMSIKLFVDEESAIHWLNSFENFKKGMD